MPRVAKLSKTLQSETLEIIAISGLVDAVLHSLDDAVLPTANWVLGLLDFREDVEEATSLKITTEEFGSFQKNSVKPFMQELKSNIASRFSSQNIEAVFNIFNLKKIPDTESNQFKTYGKQSLETLLQHYGVSKAAVTPNGDVFTNKLIYSNI